MTTDTLWRALEAMPVRAGVEAQWRAALGEAEKAIRPFFETLNEYATSYPCPEPGDDGCPRRVVEHARDDIVAVCQRTPRTCDTIPLSRKDIVIRRFDILRLASWLVTKLGLRGGTPSRVDGIRHTALCGVYRPEAGTEYRVYLTMQPDTDAMTAAVERLLAREPQSFALVVPTTDLITEAGRELLRSRGATVLTLGALTVLADDGALDVAIAPADAFAPLHEGVAAPASGPAKKGMVHFATPPDAAWTDVRIRFTDRQTVSVTVLGETGVFSYADMGMVDRRGHRPSVQWDLLYTFAENNGWLTWGDRAASKQLKKRYERLVEKLRRFFQIKEGRPIRFSRRPRGWQAELLLSI